jgi:hypothetical protein
MNDKKQIIEKNDKALPQSEPSAQQVRDIVFQKWVGDTERNSALIPEELDRRKKLDNMFLERVDETIKLCNEAQGIDNFINSLPGKTEEELKGAIMRIFRELELRREHA